MKLLGMLWAVMVVSVSAAEHGQIAGTVAPAQSVRSVVAVERGSGQKYRAQVEPVTGGFVIDRVPFGAEYDCVIEFAEAAMLEGVNMRVPRSDYEEEQPLTAEDAALLREKVRTLNQFEDQVEVLAVAGNIQHAVVIINKLRTKSYVNSQPGEVIWRAERYRFERPDETWIKVTEELFTVYHRERFQRARYDKLSITFDPRLGGLRPTPENPQINLGRITLPAPTPGVRMREVLP